MNDEIEDRTTLIAICEDYKEIEQRISLNPELFKSIPKYIASDILRNKTDNVLNYYEYLKKMIELYDEEQKRLVDKKKIMENKLKRLEDYIIYCMKFLEKDQLDGRYKSVKFRKRSKVLNVYDEKIIPSKYKTQEIITKIDKVAIKKDIESGICVLGAVIDEGEQKLIIN